MEIEAARIAAIKHKAETEEREEREARQGQVDLAEARRQRAKRLAELDSFEKQQAFVANSSMSHSLRPPSAKKKASPPPSPTRSKALPAFQSNPRP